MEDILKELLNNIFEPGKDLSVKLPDKAGAYLICAKSIDVLPGKMKELEFEFLNGLPVIYVGIAGRPSSRMKSLRKRDYKNHFNGTARKSTLRKSLGVLFGFEKEYENEENRLKYKFTNSHEKKLTEWMKENLIMYFVSIDNPMEFEVFLINTYRPPLNIKDNNCQKNIFFRKDLITLRTAR